MNDSLKKKVVYAELVKSKIAAALPDKHKDRPEQYKAYLAKELRLVQAQIEELKLEGVKK